MRLFVFAASVACASACAHREPPQWDAGGASLAVAPLPSGSSTLPSASASGAIVADAAAPPPDAGTAEVTRDAAAPREAPATANAGQDAGALPQTHDKPEPSGAAFDARVAGLWDAIAHDEPDRAMPFFFPLAAYEQVKAIGHPARDWKLRLVAAYVRDIHDLHIKLGPNAARAKFVRADVPMAKARWVDPGEEYNKLGYYRVFGTKLRGEIDGRSVALDVTSLISWRGEWYCVHLTGVK
jgi:hypothetical protein